MGKRQRTPLWVLEKQEARHQEAVQMAHKRASVRFRRNDRCLCGSGKKIKDCCVELLESKFGRSDSSPVVPVRWALVQKGNFVADETGRVLIFRSHRSARRTRSELSKPGLLVGSMGEDRWQAFQEEHRFIDLDAPKEADDDDTGEGLDP